MTDTNQPDKSGKYALLQANGMKWPQLVELIRKDHLEELAAQCDPLCDCSCCGAILRGIHPDPES